MSVALAISRVIDEINSWIGKMVAWLILVAVLVSAGNAIIRKVFNMSSNAWLELQWYLFGAAFMLAAAYTLQQNEHIRIDIVYGQFSRRTQHWIDLFGHVFFLMPFVLLMIWLLRSLCLALPIRSGEVSTNAGGLIIWPAKALLLVGFVLLVFQGISEIIKKIAVMRGDHRRSDPVSCRPMTRPNCEAHGARDGDQRNDGVHRAEHGADHVRSASSSSCCSAIPVAFSLAANGLLFFVIGVELAPLSERRRSRWTGRCFTRCRERFWGVMSNDTLLAIPFFTFMGIVLERSGMAEDLLDTIGQLFGPIRGGLAYAVIFVGALLAATTGVVAASVIAMGLISLPIMLRYGYDRRVASGVIAASGTLAQIIPPSLVLIVLADQLGRSVGDMYHGRDHPGPGADRPLHASTSCSCRSSGRNSMPALPLEARTLGHGVTSLLVGARRAVDRASATAAHVWLYANAGRQCRHPGRDDRRRS